jgi:tetratricopeptide (TPR) repeat protein
MAVKPRIFISAVSAELRSTRQLVANVLQRLGYDPIWQEIFGTEPGDLRQVLRDKIDDCDGLIQLVGRGYGAEPPQPDADLGRVSYTQFEFLYARQQQKQTWVVFAEEGCTHDRPLEQLDLPPDPAHPDPAAYQAERRAWQVAWRQRLRDEGHLRHAAASDIELELKIERLKDEFAQLRRRFQRHQRIMLAFGLVSIVLLVGALAGQGWLKRDTQKIKQAAHGLMQTTAEAQKKTGEQLAEIQAGQKVTAAKIQVHLLEASERARDKALAAAKKEPRFDKRERLKELAESAHAARLSRIDDLAASFAEIEGRSDVTDEFRELLRILQDEKENPVDKALAYAEKRRSARLDRVRARKLAEQERNRAELQIDLKAASLEATRGDDAAARQLFAELIELEPNWPEALETFAVFLFDQSIQSEFHGTLREAVADAQLCHNLASRLHSLDETKHDSQRVLSAASNQVGDVLVTRGQPGDAEQAFIHYTRSLKERERLLEQNPESAEAARDVSVSLNNLGDFLAQRGQPGDAELAFGHYTRSLELGSIGVYCG